VWERLDSDEMTRHSLGPRRVTSGTKMFRILCMMGCLYCYTTDTTQSHQARIITALRYLSSILAFTRTERHLLTPTTLAQDEWSIIQTCHEDEVRLILHTPNTAERDSFRASPTSLRPLYTGGPVLLTKDGEWLITTMGEEVLVTEVKSGLAVGRIRGVGQ
jgi:hypothetical protein